MVKLSGARCSACIDASSLRHATRVVPTEDFAQCFASTRASRRDESSANDEPYWRLSPLHTSVFFIAVLRFWAQLGRQRHGRTATASRSSSHGYPRGPMARTTRSVRYEASRTKQHINRLFNIQYPVSNIHRSPFPVPHPTYTTTYLASQPPPSFRCFKHRPRQPVSQLAGLNRTTKPNKGVGPGHEPTKRDTHRNNKLNNPATPSATQSPPSTHPTAMRSEPQCRER